MTNLILIGAAILILVVWKGYNPPNEYDVKYYDGSHLIWNVVSTKKPKRTKKYIKVYNPETETWMEINIKDSASVKIEKIDYILRKEKVPK